MGANKSIEHFLGITPTMKRRERGQILVLVAIFMVGLLVATGLAVDAGFLMLRKGQFDRALDSAVLSGATQLSTGTIDVANTRGLQFLAVNGIVIPSARSGECVNGALPDNLDYCGHSFPGAMPGAIRYRAIARWNVPTFFMPLIDINHVVMNADATAEYFSMVDIYAGDIAEYGLIKTATLALFGPEICTGYGDPYTPDTRQNGSANPWYDELNGVYHFRIGIPPTYAYKTVRIEIFDPASSNTTTYYNGSNSYQVWNATTLGVSTMACPATANQKNTCTINNAATDTNNPWWFVRTDENRGSSTSGNCAEPGSYTAGYETDTLYRLYYQRRTNTGLFEDVDLAYYRSGTSAGTDPKAAEAVATDNMWVAPGTSAAERNIYYPDILYNSKAIPSPSGQPLNSPAEPATTVDNCETWRTGTITVDGRTVDPSQAVACSTPNEPADRLGNFVVNLEEVSTTDVQETPNIYVDPNTGYRYIYLDVRAIDGASENGFQLWAGPSNLEEPASRAPSYVNARQVYIQLERAKATPVNWHLSKGLLMYGMGHLPMNHNATNRVEFPLAYLGNEFAGQDVSIRMFDPDAGSETPIYFFFDNMPKQDWTACFADGTAAQTKQQCRDASGNNNIVVQGPADLPNGDNWSVYKFKIPSEFDDTNPMPFYGGRLMVSYKAAANDTFGWYIVAESRPVLVGS